MGQVTRGCVSAQTACDRIHCGIPSHLPEGVCRAFAHRIWTHYESGDFPQAEEICRLMIRTVVDQSDVRWSMYAQSLLAMIFLAKDRPEEAFRIYSDILRVGEQCFDRFQVEMADALYGMALCHYDLVEIPEFYRVAQQFFSFPRSECSCYRQIQEALLHGLIALRKGSSSEALLRFNAMRRFRLTSPYYGAIAMLGIAESALQMQDRETAQKVIEGLDHFVHAGLEGAILAWRNFFPSTIICADHYGYNWPSVPMPLSYLGRTATLSRPREAEITCILLGEPQLKVFGSPVELHSSQKSQELLAFLLMHPKGVSMDQIRTHLWPDAPNTDAIHKCFEKLRNYLGNRQLVVYTNGIYRIDAHCWVDIIEYERLYVSAQERLLIERIDPYRSAIQLFRGDFLPGSDNLWVREERLRLRNLQAWLLWMIGAIYDRDHQELPALQFLNEALKVNPLFDPAVEHKMRLLDQMDDRTEAIAFYRQYQERVKVQWGIEPSPKLSSIVERWEVDPTLLVTGPFQKKDLLRAARLPTQYGQLAYTEIARADTSR